MNRIVIKNLGPKPFHEATAREMVQSMQWRNVQPYADYRKADLCRSKKENVEIIRLFNLFINSPGVEEALTWCKGYILCIYKNTNINQLRFYGHHKHVEHHSSSIDGCIKFILHKLLHHNGSKKPLIDRHSAALVGFGVLPLYEKTESGNVYQGFNTHYQCNVLSHTVKLSDEQQTMAKKILRLIHRRN